MCVGEGRTKAVEMEKVEYSKDDATTARSQDGCEGLGIQNTLVHVLNELFYIWL